MQHSRDERSAEALNYFVPEASVMILPQGDAAAREGKLTVGLVKIHTPPRGVAQEIALSFGKILSGTGAQDNENSPKRT